MTAPVMGVTIASSFESVSRHRHKRTTGAWCRRGWRPSNRRTHRAVSTARTKESVLMPTGTNGEFKRRATGISRPGNIRDGQLFNQRALAARPTSYADEVRLTRGARFFGTGASFFCLDPKCAAALSCQEILAAHNSVTS